MMGLKAANRKNFIDSASRIIFSECQFYSASRNQCQSGNWAKECQRQPSNWGIKGTLTKINSIHKRENDEQKSGRNVNFVRIHIVTITIAYTMNVLQVAINYACKKGKTERKTGQKHEHQTSRQHSVNVKEHCPC